MITAYLHQSASLVTPADRSTTDAYGRRTGTATTTAIRCRLQMRKKLILLPNGETTESQGLLYTDTSVAADQQILCDGTTYRALFVQQERLLNGDVEFYRVELGYG